jgi:hypothetical protein
MIEKLDATSNYVPRRNLPKQKARKQNEDVAGRTRSKFGRTDQNVADRNRSKLQAIRNSSGKEMFFPLYNAAMLKGQENWKNVDVPFHLGASESLIYHSALVKPKSQSELDWFHQLHVLGKTEDDLDESWECTKVFKYCEDSGMDMSTNHHCLVQWDDMNKSHAIYGLQRIKGNILVRFEPTNLRIVYLNDYLRNLKYVYLNSWV